MKEEVMKILNEAPSSRKLLLENYDNLLNVAEYCHYNYTQQQSGDDSLKALEETKKLTAQSLASIAYQISTLATSVLSLLDAQTNQLRHMESSINLIGQTVEMHREKVSRREIGIFTAVRQVPRGPKILPPPQPAAGSQSRPPYSRRPISYQQLDYIGHGLKLPGKQSEGAGSIGKQASSISCNVPPVVLPCPVAPLSGSSTFGKPVAPPTIPTDWRAPPEDDIVPAPGDDAPPSPPDFSEMPMAPPSPPDFSEMPMAPPPLPDDDDSTPGVPPFLPNSPDVVLPVTPPLCLETVLEESSLPPPSPPPTDDDAFPALSNDELPAPPPSSQEVDALLPRRCPSCLSSCSAAPGQEEPPAPLTPACSLSLSEGAPPPRPLSLPARRPITHDPPSPALSSPACPRPASSHLLAAVPPPGSPGAPGSGASCPTSPAAFGRHPPAALEESGGAVLLRGLQAGAPVRHRGRRHLPDWSP
ncbi:ABI family, member 3a isoform X2 [Nerophis lumbriciformis]|uniref:ABI family, member 3a isoform X2 n=1 Tax=Nerophis lumbriciformis TaxID=546530 RepID=UPI002AE071DE|nr:ABI family, member 3a isoform X2 [Nerophis lumbriciformis]